MEVFGSTAIQSFSRWPGRPDGSWGQNISHFSGSSASKPAGLKCQSSSCEAPIAMSCPLTALVTWCNYCRRLAVLKCRASAIRQHCTSLKHKLRCGYFLVSAARLQRPTRSVVVPRSRDLTGTCGEKNSRAFHFRRVLAASAASCHAASLASKGRLIRCTVLESMPNRAAIWRFESVLPIRVHLRVRPE